MKKSTILTTLLIFLLSLSSSAANKQKPQADLWPDGTQIEAWFKDTSHIDISKLGKQYVPVMSLNRYR